VQGLLLAPGMHPFRGRPGPRQLQGKGCLNSRNALIMRTLQISGGYKAGLALNPGNAPISGPSRTPGSYNPGAFPDPGNTPMLRPSLTLSSYNTRPVPDRGNASVRGGHLPLNCYKTRAMSCLRPVTTQGLSLTEHSYNAGTALDP
jgi:hypothetical protein